MTTQKPTKRIVLYRLPAWRKAGGGWRYGYALELDVDDNGNGVWKIQPIGRGRPLRIPESDVQDVA